jgi:large subunit ribosomal protein L19e
VKRVAADTFGVGLARIKIIDREKSTQAMTRDDVRGLLSQGAIMVRPLRGSSRARARVLMAQRKKGRRSGHGTRKGASGARATRKSIWVSKIRGLRAELNVHKPKLKEGSYQKLYSMSKGGFFRSKTHLRLYIKEKALLKV